MQLPVPTMRLGLEPGEQVWLPGPMEAFGAGGFQIQGEAAASSAARF